MLQMHNMQDYYAYMLDLAEVRTFLAVAESGSVNRAARLLNLSQPAVSRQVQRLEAQLGAPLLDRRTKPPALTPAGRAALEACRALVRAARDLEAATAAGAGPAGELALGVTTPVSDLVLVDPLDAVRTAFPAVALRLASGFSRPLVEAVRAGALDAAVVQMPAGETPAGLAARRLGAERLVVVAAARGGPRHVRSLADLAPFRWVVNPDGCGVRARLERALVAAGAPFRLAVETHGADLQLSLVARGAGLGLVPERALAGSPLAGQVRRLSVPGYDVTLDVLSVRGRPPVSLLPVIERFEAAVEARLAGRATRTR